MAAVQGHLLNHALRDNFADADGGCLCQQRRARHTDVLRDRPQLQLKVLDHNRADIHPQVSHHLSPKSFRARLDAVNSWLKRRDDVVPVAFSFGRPLDSGALIANRDLDAWRHGP